MSIIDIEKDKNIQVLNLHIIIYKNIIQLRSITNILVQLTLHVNRRELKHLIL